ncbi:hypothetical protein HY091_02335 [Candidatus Kaiserbacteria bacterium]|nr:hypothetical protein [Candidatus Kaiserbacteria bacterium]
MARVNYILDILTVLERESWLSPTEILTKLKELYLERTTAERPSWFADNFPKGADYFFQPSLYWTGRYLDFLYRTGSLEFRTRPGQFTRCLWWRFQVPEYALTPRGRYWRTRAEAYDRQAQKTAGRAHAPRPVHA